MDITRGIPEELNLDSIVFVQSSFECNFFVFEAEDTKTEKLWYVVLSGVSRITNSIPPFRIPDLSIVKNESALCLLVNGKETGLVFESADLLSEDEFEKFEDNFPKVQNLKVISCLDKNQ
jgi:hypothetical protein